MVGRGNQGLGFHGALVILVFVPILFFVFRRRWRLDEARKEEVQRLALIAAAEEQRAEFEATMAYLSVSMAKEAPRPPMATPMLVCALCFAPATARCAKCKAVRYCSGNCQIAHWRRGHKDVCSPPSDNYNCNGPSTVSSLGEQVEQIDVVNGEFELEAQAPVQAFQNLLEPFAASVLTSTSDALDENNKVEEMTDSSGTRSTSSAMDSSKPKSSVFLSNVTQQAASFIDEYILNETTLDDLPSSQMSPRSPVTAVYSSNLDLSKISCAESTSSYSAVNSIPYSSLLHQNESIPTVETVEGSSCEHQSDINTERKLADLSGGKDHSAVFGRSSFSGLKVLNPCDFPATEESKYQLAHEKAKASSYGDVDSVVISTTNNESGVPGLKTHSSPAVQLPSSLGDDAIRASRASSMDSASLNPGKSVDDKDLIRKGIIRSADRIVNVLKVPKPLQMDSANMGPKKSLDDGCPIPSGVITSARRVVNPLTEQKTFRHYQSELMLFPYDQFVKLYNCNTIELRPCGLVNCGNSCYANAVLQCLAFTRPLTAYFLKEFHSNKCKKSEWCITCELQKFLVNVKKGKSPLSPLGILSHLENIGGNFGHGRQEDAHEFFRFVVEDMQSDCLKEAGVKPGSQLTEETTLIQQTFGGYLQSKIKCSRCKGKSERCERMMDLTVDIHGDINTLEEALKHFTSDEILDGENKYACLRCKSHVRAKKRLTILEAPNILVIALKRFQSGKFGKLNKTVQFPEYLDLAPYMSVTNDKSPIYQLYAVVVHIDVMNSSQSGHYVCYVKDTQGGWYNLDDNKVRQVDLGKVLSVGAYMLLYARCSPHAPSFVRKAMAYQSAKLKRIKSNFWDKSGHLQ